MYVWVDFLSYYSVWCLHNPEQVVVFLWIPCCKVLGTGNKTYVIKNIHTELDTVISLLLDF